MARFSFKNLQNTYGFAPESLEPISINSEIIAAKKSRFNARLFLNSLEKKPEFYSLFGDRDLLKERFVFAANEVLVNAMNYSFDTNVTFRVSPGVNRLAANISAAVIHDFDSHRMHMLVRNSVVKEVADDLRRRYISAAERPSTNAADYPIDPRQQPLLQEGGPVGPLLSAKVFLTSSHIHGSQGVGVYDVRNTMQTEIAVRDSSFIPNDKISRDSLEKAISRFEESNGAMPANSLRSVTVFFSAQL